MAGEQSEKHALAPSADSGQSPTLRAPSTPPPRASRAGLFTAALLGVLALAAFVRIATLGVQDYWVDELHTLLSTAANRAEFVALPLGEIVRGVPRYTALSEDTSARAVWTGMREDTHPPVYFTLLYGWRRLFGDGEFAVRLLSALLSVLSIVPVALILRRQPRVALGAALILSLSLAHIQMGQQARQYSLSLLLVSVSFWLLLDLERCGAALSRRQRVVRLCAYAFVVTAAMLTHYFSGLVLLAQAAHALLRLRGRLLRGWLVSVAVAALAWAVLWGPAFLQQRRLISAQVWLLDPADDHARRTCLRAADLPVRLLLHRPLPDWEAAGVWFQGIAGVVLLGTAVVLAWRHRRAEAMPFLLWYGVPVIVLATLDFATGKELLTHLRFSCVAGPGLAGLAAIAIGSLRPRHAAIVAAALAITAALTLKLPATDNPHARAAARLLADEVKPDDLIIFDGIGWPPFWAQRDFILVWYYMPDATNASLMLDRPPSTEVLERIRSYDRYFVVSPRVDAIPNHTPETHALAGRSPYIHQIGWVYVFTQTRPSSTPGPG